MIIEIFRKLKDIKIMKNNRKEEVNKKTVIKGFSQHS